MIVGQIISGMFGQILVRQKAGKTLEMGELVIAETKEGKMLLQVNDLLFGSQLSDSNLELISGLKLEDDNNLEFYEKDLRNYTLAKVKNLAIISDGKARMAKSLPEFFSEVRELEKEDVTFLVKPAKPLFMGKLRTGSKSLDLDVFLDAEKALSHHILIPAMTGKGKSNFTSCMLWSNCHYDFAGMLVLDPHDEYFGRESIGLKDHPHREKVAYYTPADVPPGGYSLKINIKAIKPKHFNGVVNWSDPQKEALNAFYSAFGNQWIEAIFFDKDLPVDFNKATIGVVKRRLLSLLNMKVIDNAIQAKGIFDIQAGAHTIKDIVAHLEAAKTVIIDTSHFSGDVEILIGSLVASEAFSRYKRHKLEGTLSEKPVISIVLEEAPRVLGKDVLERGSNIFSTIAREGRKFKVGLIAITQLPSLIPKEILANMNTKIILGIEMQAERNAVIESASQDLSDDTRTIASLDTGEAIISSSFVKFAIPIKIPLFSEIAKHDKASIKTMYSGMKQ